MGIFFNLQKKILEREIAHEKKQAIKDKVRADKLLEIEKLQGERQKITASHALELQRLKARANKARHGGLTSAESRVLAEQEEKRRQIAAKRVDALKKAGHAISSGAKVVGTGAKWAAQDLYSAYKKRNTRSGRRRKSFY